MKSQTTRFVILLCLFVSATTGSALRAAPEQKSPLSAPSDADIYRAGSFGLLNEKLVPIGGATTPEENIDLTKAIDSYARSNDQDDQSALLNFLRDHPRSPWRAAILTSVGIRYRQTGWFLKALAAWKEAWELSKHDHSPLGKPLADRAIGEMAELNIVLGRKAEVEKVLKELGKRPLKGPATEKVTVAREGLWLLRHQPENVLKCGPFALARIAAGDNPRAIPHPDILSAKATAHGTSLAQVWKLSHQIGMNYQMAKRKPGAEVIVPSVVNWKANHFAAVVGEQEGKFLVKDPTSRQNLLITKAALDAETSGYSLVPAGPLPAGWSRVSETEGRRVWGAGGTQYHNPGTKPWDDKAKKCPGSLGMATYNFHTQVVSLNIMDTPVGYTPPLGPDMHFTITYNQREELDTNQEPPETISNFGSNWVCNWIAHVSRTIHSNFPARVHLPGGGVEDFGHSSGPDLQSGATLTLTGDPKVEESYFTRVLPDGSRQLFELLLHSHRYYMTEWTDPEGNTVHFNYIGFRLNSVTDALGQPTLIEHNSDNPNDLPDYYLIKKITDPFGGYAMFEYDKDHQLVRIQDAVGIVSEFHYEKETDFVDRMTTPYAITHFSRPESQLDDQGEPGNARIIQAQDDATGEIERVEFGHLPEGVAPGILAEEPPSELPNPAPIPIVNGGYRLRNTFYWDKRTTQMYPPVNGVYDYTKAKIIHWVHDSPGFELYLDNIKEREKMPLEKPVYYFYPDQQDPRFAGTTGRPSAVARVVGDGTTETWKYEYNSKHNITQATDPKGRITSYEYAANGVDLLAVYKRNPAGASTFPPTFSADKIFGCTYYPNTRLRHVVTDAAGQPTTYTYTSLNQLETVTNARSETTTYGYGDGSSTEKPLGYLISITSPPVQGASAVTKFTYENGRVRTVTSNPDGYVKTIDSDHFDRTTQIAYPDGTTEEFHYTDSVRGMTLDLTESKDRLNRWTYRHYNADRQMDSITDPADRTTTFDWCGCGSLESITDPKQQVTTFHRDVQGRLYQKVFADNTTIDYLFDGQSAPNTSGATSRLKSSTDALNRVTSFYYFKDGNISQVHYFDPSVGPLPPAVHYTYEDYHNRLKTMDDGIGHTEYTYYPITAGTSLGGGRLQDIDGPLQDDTITYTYDELGRVQGEAINGVVRTVERDPLGRVTDTENELGQFTRTYEGPTERLQSVTYPNLVTTNYFHFDNNQQDRRLQTLQNLSKRETSPLSVFDYTYDAVGQIRSWIRALGSTDSQRHFEYDNAQQLRNVRNHANPEFVTEMTEYDYDLAGNRSSDHHYHPEGPLGNGTLHQYSLNNVNQIETITTTAGGTITWEVTLAHDAAGNMTYDGSLQTFEWDVANRLTAVTRVDSGQRSEFAYDGLGRRVKITEFGPGALATIRPQSTDYASFNTAPFTLPSGSYTITFEGLGDDTILIDYVLLSNTLVANGSFETPDVYKQPGSYQYNPSGATWSFTGPSGLAYNGSDITAHNPDAPDNKQVAFIQEEGTMSQTHTVSAGTYTLSFYAAQGGYNKLNKSMRVTVRPSVAGMTVKRFVWCGTQMCEERDSVGTTVTKQFFAEGEKRTGGSDAGNYYYTRDHLGSIREVTSSNGSLLARYDYDAYGNAVVVNGTTNVAFGYTGHYVHAPSGLNLAPYRAYNPAIGRWLSRDPMQETGGLNLYQYVENDPINLVDPTGLMARLPSCEIRQAICQSDCIWDCPASQGQTNAQYEFCTRWCNIMYNYCLLGKRPPRIPPQLNPPVGDPWRTPGYDPWRPFGPGSMKPPIQ